MQSSNTHVHLVFLLCVFCAASLFAQAVIADTPERQKPYLVVTPPKPIAKSDTVSLQVLVGTASNACMVPTFSNCTYTIVQSPLAIFPPEFVVTVGFIQDPLPSDKVCTTVYDPVDYGPRFSLGLLEQGTYTVVTGDPPPGTPEGIIDSQLVLGKFSVTPPGSILPAAVTIRGTVVDDPYPLERVSMPVPKAVVYLLPAGSTGLDADRMIVTGVIDSAITDENGNYSITRVVPGSYTLACRHPEYKTVSVVATVRKDTTINLTLISVSAAASVAGVVSLVSADAVRPVPVEGCTVTVGKYADVSGSTVAERFIAVPKLRAVTDKDGKYSISGIPIAANGEAWAVRANIRTFTETKRVVLSNMTNAAVDFTLSELYANSASVIFRGATITAAADKYVYQENEPVKIRYSITNFTTSAMTFGPFARGCEYDLFVNRGNDIEVYRASAQPICSDVVSEVITVEPGQTVTHDFPAWYIADLMSALLQNTMVAPRSILLRFSARLRGRDYDTTLVGVRVTIEFNLPLGTVAAPKTKNGSAVSFNAAQNMLSLNLDKPQNVSVKIYTLEGAMLPVGSTRRQFPAGMHKLSLQSVLPNGARSRGVYIIGVRGATFEQRFSTVTLKK